MVTTRVGRAREWSSINGGEGGEEWEEGVVVVSGRAPVRMRVTRARVKRVREREREK